MNKPTKNTKSDTTWRELFIIFALFITLGICAYFVHAEFVEVAQEIAKNNQK